MAAVRVTQYLVEALIAAPARVNVSQYVVEMLIERPTPSPTTITGAGVSQYLIEVLLSPAAPKVRVAQYVVEVLMAAGDNPAPASGAVTTGWVTII